MAQADRAYRNDVRMQRHMNPQAQLLALAHHYARSEVRAAMKERGIKINYVEQKEINAAARLLLAERWAEFAAQAEALIARIESGRSKKGRSSNSSANARTENNGQPVSQR